MQSQQIVDYIAENLRAGHSEATIREHLLASGWSQTATDDAFVRYGDSLKEPKKTSTKRLRRGGRPQRRRWTKRRIIKAATGGVVLIALVGLGAIFLSSRHSKVQPPSFKQLTYQQKQTIDVNTIAGAVGQYAFANDVLPTHLSVGSDSRTLVMCNATCDPTTSQISSLSVYTAPNVKIEPYVPALAVPDIHTLFLVPNAKCVNGTTLGGSNPKPRSMIILYATDTTSGLSQSCVTL